MIFKTQRYDVFKKIPTFASKIIKKTIVFNK